MVDLGLVEAQLGIEDVQVDADTGLVTDVLDTVIFTGLVDDGLRFFDLLGRTADVEVGLLDLELDRFTGLLFRFPGDEEVLFGLVDFGLGSAAIIEIIGYASCYLPASLIGIDAGEGVVSPVIAASNGYSRFIAGISDVDTAFRFLDGNGCLEDFRPILHGVVHRFLKGNIIGIERQLMVGQVELRFQGQAEDIVQVRFGNGHVVICRNGRRLGIGQGDVRRKDVDFGLGADVVLGLDVIQVSLEVVDGFVVNALQFLISQEAIVAFDGRIFRRLFDAQDFFLGIGLA